MEITVAQPINLISATGSPGATPKAMKGLKLDNDLQNMISRKP